MAQHSFQTGDGCRIAYKIDGSAENPPLILSGSLATDLSMWDEVVGLLAKEFRVVRYDLRGHGGSSVPSGAYSVARLGHDVLALLDHLELDRVNFCGTSIGGFIGQWLGIVSPDRLNRLILSNTSSCVGPPSVWDERISQTLSSTIDDTANVLLDGWFTEAMFNERPATIRHYRDMIRRTSPQGIVACFAAVRDADFRRTVSAIPTPTLVIGGNDDNPTLPAHSEAIAAAVQGAQLRFLPGIHMLVAEHPEMYVKLVIDFLEA